MADPSILKRVIEGVGKIGAETVERGVKEGVNIGQSVISGQELLGGIKKLDEKEEQQLKDQEEVKKKEEMDRLRETSAYQGRDVEREIKEIRDEKVTKEEEEQKQFLEQIRLQREAEAQEREELLEPPGNAKREAAKTQFAPGKRKKQAPDTAQMSQTSEFKGVKARNESLQYPDTKNIKTIKENNGDLSCGPKYIGTKYRSYVAYVNGIL